MSKTSPLKEQRSVDFRVKEPMMVTEPRLETQEELHTEQDLYLAESVGVDITADSTVLKEFDYNESVDMKD